jgi:hypothetical protein
VEIHLTLILCECLSSTVHQAHERLKKPHMHTTNTIFGWFLNVLMTCA